MRDNNNTNKTWLYIIAVILTSSTIALSLIFLQNLPQDYFDKFFSGSNPELSYTPKPSKESTKTETKNTDEILENAEGPFRVIKVRDGDTIELENSMVVRYLYVDTPETVKPNTPTQCFGPESSQFNKDYVLDKVVYLVKDKSEKDQYGRDLRLVFIEGKDTKNPKQSVNAELVKLGFAKAKFYSPNTKFKQTFQDLENSAKEQKVGLWSACAEK